MTLSFRTVLWISSVAIIVGCASSPTAVNFPADTDVTTKLSEVRARMNDDQAKQYDLFAPRHFQEASDSVLSAQKKKDNGDRNDAVLKDLARAAANLGVVEELGAKHSTELLPITTARQAAISAGAAQVSTEQLANADYQFRELGRDVEKDNARLEAKEISNVEAQYALVELASVKKTSLGESRRILDNAENRGAKSKAPQTWGEAQVL